MKIRKGDKVKVLYGKDAGKTGSVLRVIAKKNMVVVDGVNLFKKHSKGNGRDKNSEILTISKALPISKVQLIDPGTQKPSRIGWKIENDKKIRINKKTGSPIDVVVKVTTKDKKVDSKSSKPKSTGRNKKNESNNKKEVK